MNKLLGENKIDTNKVEFAKSINSSFIVKSNNLTCGIYIDHQKWSFIKSKSDEDSEFEFTLKGEDAYGIAITEKTEIPLETLRSIALENAIGAAPDMTVVKEEYRKVNGNTILLIQMRGTIKGIKVTYFGYYFSSSEGSVQLLTYTATNLFNGYKSDLEQFLNGLVSPAK